MKLFKSIALALTLLFASVALADQYPTSPNTGKQTTQFNSNQFTALFNGEVTVSELKQNDAKTSQYRSYTSSSNGVTQQVLLKFITAGDIAVDYTSSNFYANQFVPVVGGVEDMSNRSQGVWEGHPFTYAYVSGETDGVAWVTRTRYIIVNSREALFISQTSSGTTDDRNQWLDFEYSLRIK
jgi:hypothetical protein